MILFTCIFSALITRALAPTNGPGSAGADGRAQPLGVPANGAAPMSLTVGPHTGGAQQLPFTPSSVLPARPNLPDDPVIPHNGFATVEEGEKAFMHLLRKAGVDASWSWDQTMRTIITDPLYKSLNTLAEKKNAWQKVSLEKKGGRYGMTQYLFRSVHGCSQSEGARRERSEAGEGSTCDKEYA